MGTATVERVLNERGGVRPETVEKVIRALRDVDYPRRIPGKHQGLMRIDVLLVNPKQTFFERLARAFARIAATLDPAISVHRTFMDESNPEAIARKLMDPAIRRSAVIIAAPEHPAVRRALFALRERGVPIIQIVSRMNGLDADYIGIENAAAGRMAGLLMSGLQRRAGRVIAMCHSGIYEAHRQRVSGFSDFLARQSESGLHLSTVSFHHDDADRSRESLQEALDKHTDLVGLYNAGGTNSTLSDVLRRHSKGRDICFIGHELTERSSAALRDGTMAGIIDQVPEAQARRALDLALYRLGLLEQTVDFRPIPFVTVTKENI